MLSFLYANFVFEAVTLQSKNIWYNGCTQILTLNTQTSRTVKFQYVINVKR